MQRPLLCQVPHSPLRQRLHWQFVEQQQRLRQLFRLLVLGLLVQLQLRFVELQQD
tara:strand:+ start:424 stop:588 length:165 start_codon:yes stop_codon:yes gene_type:complete